MNLLQYLPNEVKSSKDSQHMIWYDCMMFISQIASFSDHFFNHVPTHKLNGTFPNVFQVFQMLTNKLEKTMKRSAISKCFLKFQIYSECETKKPTLRMKNIREFKQISQHTMAQMLGECSNDLSVGILFVCTGENIVLKMFDLPLFCWVERFLHAWHWHGIEDWHCEFVCISDL